MNQTFSFQRWSLLVGKHWAENKKKYLLSIVAFIGLTFVWYVFVMLVDDSNPLAAGLQQVTFLFSLFLVGPFYASQFFRELSSGPKAINYLMVPASALEKLLCSLFYVIVIFFIVFVAAFYLVDAISVMIANLIHPSYNYGNVKANVINVFRSNEMPKDVTFYFLLMFFTIQSAALLGSVYFVQYSYIKTAITIALLCLVVALLEYYLTNRLLPPGNFYEGRGTYLFYGRDGSNKVVELPHAIMNVLFILFKYAFPPILWLTTYFRLKEKEV